MADSLGDILGGKIKRNEPVEFGIIKRFVHRKFGILPKLSMSRGNIVISMPSGASAGSLRLEVTQLTAQLPKDTKLIIRIG